MTLNELRSALQAILDSEQSADVDWSKVGSLCRETRGRLQQPPGAPDYTDDFVYVFLDDADLRQEDEEYAQMQRERLRNWLEGSEILSR
jgi:hypothetical protein